MDNSVYGAYFEWNQYRYNSNQQVKLIRDQLHLCWDSQPASQLSGHIFIIVARIVIFLWFIVFWLLCPLKPHEFPITTIYYCCMCLSKTKPKLANRNNESTCRILLFLSFVSIQKNNEQFSRCLRACARIYSPLPVLKCNCSYTSASRRDDEHTISECAEIINEQK